MHRLEIIHWRVWTQQFSILIFAYLKDVLNGENNIAYTFGKH